MNYILKTSLLFFFTFQTSTMLLGQEEKNDTIVKSDSEKERMEFSPEIQSGINIGGEISDGRFVYKFAKALEISANFKFSGKVYYGFGAGVELYKDETFFPVFICFKGLLSKDDNTKYIFAQIGYAAAENKNLYSFTNYKYSGGIFFSPGIGYRFSIKDKYAIMPNISYKHQFAGVKYEGFDKKSYKEVLSFNLLSFKIGVFF